MQLERPHDPAFADLDVAVADAWSLPLEFVRMLLGPPEAMSEKEILALLALTGPDSQRTAA